MTELTLADIDVDGALQEAHAEVTGDTRGDFFKKALIGGGTILGSGALLGGLPNLAGAATKKSAKNDVKIANYALTLEYLEAAFYLEAINKGALSGTVLDAAAIVSDHETTHVKTIKKALGKAAVKEPAFDFQGTTEDSAKFLATASVLEDTGVAAYLGQVGNILNPAILALAGSILTVEARHASRLRDLNGEKFAPAAFDKPKSMAAILKAVKKTGFITG
jgi:hypothetical protein